MIHGTLTSWGKCERCKSFNFLRISFSSRYRYEFCQQCRKELHADDEDEYLCDMYGTKNVALAHELYNEQDEKYFNMTGHHIDEPANW